MHWHWVRGPQAACQRTETARERGANTDSQGGRERKRKLRERKGERERKRVDGEMEKGGMQWTNTKGEKKTAHRYIDQDRKRKGKKE